MSHKVKKIIQIIFLILFTFLIIYQKPQIWMGIFLLGIILSKFWGRFYCGYLCPINTLMEATTKTLETIGIKRYPVPQFLKNKFIRSGMLVAFLITFAFIMITGREIPVLLILLVLGVLSTIIFPESLWHRYLCPYGTILNMVGKHTSHSMTIDQEKCVNCDLCRKGCPTEAVYKSEKYEINKGLCFQCLKCSEKCPKDAIQYKTL